MTLTHPGVTAPGAAAASGRPARRHRRSSGATVVLTVIAVVVGAAFMLPAVWILVGSFRPNLEILTTMSPLSWHTIVPSELTLENYTPAALRLRLLPRAGQLASSSAWCRCWSAC